MRRHVLSNLDDLDIDARELAKAAARQAGLSLEEWAAAILAARDERRASPAQERKPAGQDAGTAMPRPSKAARPELERNFEALMAAATAESERQAQDHASRTAIALESMASWIEQTEERLNETARASADHQDRMATALSQALSTLKNRLDTVERQAVAERQTEPDKTWIPAVGTIRAEIERLRTSMDNLATREEIAEIDHALKNIVRDMGQGAASRDLLILAQSTAALYRQIQALSGEINDGLHGRIGGEIDQLKAKIDRIAETGIDRTVIDFLSSQIVDMRHDLSQRAEPRQIERLSEEVTTLGRQIADLRIHQVGRNDFSALKTSLENVCAALNRTVEAQGANDVPAQLEGIRRNLAVLVNRPAPEPVNLDPITDHLVLLTERMASLSENRFAQNDALNAMIERLSGQVQAVAEKEAPSHEPLMKRFDRIEEELRQVGRQADTASVELMLRTIDEKLDRAPPKPSSLDTLERQITSLAERLAERSDEPLQKVLEETTSHLRNLQNDAAGIAERAAKAALKDLQPNLPDSSDVDALKQGFVELKALQSRADKKTQETLRAVHDTLETLVARFPGQGAVAHASGAIPQAILPASPEQMQPADRLEAAVRRLHAVTLSQIEEVATARPDDDAKPQTSEIVVTPPALDEADLGNVRAGFIAAARRAAQADKTDQPFFTLQPEEEVSADEIEAIDAEESPSYTPASLIERIRRSIEAHRRSLLLGLGLTILVTGTAQVISSGVISSGLAPSPLSLISSAKPTQQTPVPLAKAKPHEDTAQTGSITASPDKTALFQPSSLVAPATPTLPATAKFLVDPATVHEIPAQVPTVLRQAALAGDATAIYTVASRAAEGRDMPRDMILAIHLYERAAQAGFPPAQERLAMIMEKGIGIARDPKQAVMWYERAAQGGNIRAMHNLATLLASGWNGKPDHAAALRWYNEAAEAGLKDSQFNMGVLLARGFGAKQDLPKAYKWFALAAAQGDQDAAKKRDELAGRLSAAELTAVKGSLEQWHPRPVDPLANEAPASLDGQTAALDRTQGNRS
ncbi:hypothetical protein DC522_07905 [Microvirga sp. KLBC 81]|uniref:SEL1-like repeat protein n=1 Tax=Microvirga sp. KLBC 81 TaxID=1862707 RepID=UPI000D50D4D9|nr:SEL1-like repeat protein [Microvirga sp. KLBC 81]PVE24843.1 hypothetical protein DC522_07905 [Microvirga sp. KLBC 81]